MNSLVRWCAGRPVSVAMALCALVLLGIKSAISLPLRGYPDIALPRVMVGLSMPGLPASEMNSLLVSPLEDALAAAKGLLKTASIARDGQAVLTLDFTWGELPERASGRVRDILDATYPSLPEGLEKPSVVPYNPDDAPLVIVAVGSKHGDNAFARRMAEYELVSRLRRVEGAGSIQIVGGSQREIVVAVDAGKAAGRGMTIADVAMALARENADMPAGSLREGDKELVAVVRGRATSLKELAGLKAMGPTGAFRLSELAGVDERDAKRDSLFVAQGDECVALEVYLRPGADPVGTARKIRVVIQGLENDFDDTLFFSIVGDGSTVIAQSLRNIAFAGMIGAVAAALVLFAVLRNVRAGILVAITIPLSIAVSLVVLSVFGRSLNGMSLGGMSLAIGMISDHAVVVMDALSSRFSSNDARPSPDAIAGAVASVVAGTFGSMATTAVVFMPVFFLPGALGALFGDMALALIATSVAGWFLAVLALPSAYRVFWIQAPDHGIGLIEGWYRKALAMAFRRPLGFILVACLLALGGGALVATRPLSFLPPEPACELRLEAQFPAGSDLDGMASPAAGLCEVLSSLHGIGCVFAWAGAEDDDMARRSVPGFNSETLHVTCVLDGQATEPELREAIQSTAETTLKGSVSCIVHVPGDRVAGILGLDGGAKIAVRSLIQEQAKGSADRVEETLRQQARDSLDSIAMMPNGTKPRLCLSPHREVQAAMGISLLDTARVIRAASDGMEASRIAIDGKEIAVRVLAASLDKDSQLDGLSCIEAIPLKTASGESVQARALVGFARTYEQASLARLDRAHVIYLEPRAAPGKEAQLALAIEKTLKIHPEALKSNQSAFNQYGVAMLGSLALVIVLLYLTLGSQFESFALPILIMATIPLAIAGVGPALVLSGLGLDSGSILGLIVLFGVVVNNAIFLHEATMARVDCGASRVVAAFAGASERLRPILATTLTTVVALLPLCLSNSGSAQRSMSVAMMGGLIASTVLTVFITPLALARFCLRREKRLS